MDLHAFTNATAPLAIKWWLGVVRTAMRKGSPIDALLLNTGMHGPGEAEHCVVCRETEEYKPKQPEFGYRVMKQLKDEPDVQVNPDSCLSRIVCHIDLQQ